MKNWYLSFTMILFVALSHVQAQNDSIYLWKSGKLISKQSIKPADLDSITFTNPIANLPNVVIGSQIWQSHNYDGVTYRDGTPIPQVTNSTQWANLTTGAWCYYNNNPTNNTVYGKLYNWYAVAGIYNSASLTDPSLRKQLAPMGWHVPSNDEWNLLLNFLGGNNAAGGKLKETGVAHWLSPNTGATNSTGFSGVPGGYCSNAGAFDFMGSFGYFWNVLQSSSTSAWYLNLFYSNSSGVVGTYAKKYGFSVRCIKD